MEAQRIELPGIQDIGVHERGIQKAPFISDALIGEFVDENSPASTGPESEIAPTAPIDAANDVLGPEAKRLGWRNMSSVKRLGAAMVPLAMALTSCVFQGSTGNQQFLHQREIYSGDESGAPYASAAGSTIETPQIPNWPAGNCVYDSVNPVPCNSEYAWVMIHQGNDCYIQVGPKVDGDQVRVAVFSKALGGLTTYNTYDTLESGTNHVYAISDSPSGWNVYEDGSLLTTQNNGCNTGKMQRAVEVWGNQAGLPDMNYVWFRDNWQA